VKWALRIDLQSQRSGHPTNICAGEDERFFNTGASMHSFKNTQSQNSQVLARVPRLRFLRAVPSVVLLTTAMAWGVSSHAGGVGLGGAVHGGTGISVAAGPALGGAVGAGVGVGLGANTAVQAGGEVKASGAANSATEDTGRVLGGVRETGQSVGGAAARTGKRVTHAAKGEAASGVKSGAASVKLDAAGSQGVTKTR
jgi:hypothetical protein